MTDPARAVSVVIPAHDEGAWIDACLAALWASDPVPGGAEAIVVANGCADDTAARARAHAGRAAAAGWGLRVVELATGGKPGALDAGDRAASGGTRIYLDADVTVSPPLVAQLAAALDAPEPRYAGGTPLIAPARSAVSRAYARFWARLPFMAEGVPGFGVYAVSAAGRARWGEFPRIISDDTFVRLSFAPSERVRVPATYRWPVVEGLGRLVAVRRRQDAGVREVARRFPDHPARDDKRSLGAREVLRLGLRDPLGFLAYGLVSAAVRRRRGREEDWTRGR